MRLKRISLFALMSLVVTSGCSANRNAATSLRGEREHVTEPPRHDHEYSPSLTPEDDEFLEPPSGEPAPAPPALGVSRVKSVSWLRDFGSRKREVPTPDFSCSDEELIGKCSPIEPCVPNSECGTQPFATPSRPAPQHGTTLGRMRKSMSRLLGRKSTPTTAKECADLSASASCTTSEIPQHNSVPKSRVSSDLPEGHGCKTEDSSLTPKVRRNMGALHPDCRKECLAEPLLETNFDPTEPGLITPADRVPVEPERSFDPVIDLPEQNTDLPSPETPDPSEPTHPVPEAPQIETPDPATTNFVEPPLWPKLEERAEIRSISHSISRSIKPGAANKSQSASKQILPQAPSGPMMVMPRPRQ